MSGQQAELAATPAVVRRRAAYAAAINFYEDWLKKMHSQWDGIDKKTLLLQPKQRTLPVAAYQQTVLLPDGITDSQVRAICLNDMYH